MRTLGGALTAHLATRSHTRCGMMLIQLDDGTEIGLTDHDRDLTFSLLGEPVTYSARSGIFPSALALTEGFDADNIEVAGPIGETVSLEATLGGRFDRATVYLFEVNWKSLGSGSIPLMLGKISEARVEGGRFIFSIRSLVDYFNSTIGRLITPYCDADFGDSRCGYDVPEVAATVTGVVDAMRFVVSFAGTYADGFFNQGTISFDTGALAGTHPIEIFGWSALGGIVLFEPAAAAPEVGDTLTIRQGCAKTRAACKAFGNILNFRGFPEVPGSDQALKWAQLGGGGT